MIRIVHPAFFCVISLYALSFGTTYYVDNTNGSSSGNGRSESSAWNSIDNANQALRAGDTVFIREGNYREQISPDHDGTKEYPIVYMNYPSEVVKISGIYRGLHFNGNSHVIVEGIRCEEVNQYLRLDSSDHIWIKNCIFDNANSEGGWPLGVRFRKDSHHNRITGCIIGRVGYSTSSDDKGGVINIGTGSDISDHSHYNLIEGNVFFYGGHHIMTVSSSYNIIRNNYFNNRNWMDCLRSETGGKCGNRAIIFEENAANVTGNIVEGNRFAATGVPPDQNTSGAISIRMPHTIIRHNMFYHCDGYGISLSTSKSEMDCRNSFIYNNTFYRNGYTALSGVEEWKNGAILMAHHSSGPEITGVIIKNNIFYDNNGDYIRYYYVDEADQILENNWKDNDDPLFMDITGTIDSFDLNTPDFRLKEGSLCVDSGAFLTTITSASGSGSRFTVDNAGYFTDGMGIIEGDVIQIEGENKRARITDIDYSTNTITVDNELAWDHDEGINLAFNGSRPDLGALEQIPSDATPVALAGNTPANSHQRLFGFTQSPEGITVNLREPGDFTIALYSMAGKNVYYHDVKELSTRKVVIPWGSSITSGAYVLKVHQGLKQKSMVVTIKR
ncbi:MAG: hypothetical protein GF401_06940 [Chitinivibrionales bacterium]|nr:hypothetical protein [Chitinivibrionales bacterium]